MSELVTGDAVVLGLRPARLPSRAVAVCIDLAALLTGYLLLTVLVLTAVGSLDDAATAAVSGGLAVLVLMGVPVAVETLSHGRSLGKLACGLRVVREDGGPIRFRHALVRGLLGFVEILATLGVVACVASLVSARGRRLGDVFAGTLVVRERLPVPRTAAVPPPPPWLAGYFADLDLSRVPDPLWLAVRQYLTRSEQLDPQVSASMAARLAQDVAAWTGAAPPQGVPPVGYLTGVLAERQDREARRAWGTGGPRPQTASHASHAPHGSHGPHAPHGSHAPHGPQPEAAPHAPAPHSPAPAAPAPAAPGAASGPPPAPPAGAPEHGDGGTAGGGTAGGGTGFVPPS
ncbi:RDD family protein [Streptomyces sp. TRM70308]|uniref:RDD family protein n=1 Tax=Streptomyces sp. TRM70308 TaxID=3131932 RepID=UPI003CFDE2EB